MSAAPILGRLKAAGLALRPEGDKVIVSPRDRLSDELLELIRIHKPAILQELAAEMAQTRNAIKAAHDVATPGMQECREALVIGRLHVCCNCSRFTFGLDRAGLGNSQRFNVEAWPFAPFWCSGFESSDKPVARELLAYRDPKRKAVKWAAV